LPNLTRRFAPNGPRPWCGKGRLRLLRRLCYFLPLSYSVDVYDCAPIKNDIGSSGPTRTAGTRNLRPVTRRTRYDAPPPPPIRTSRFGNPGEQRLTVSFEWRNCWRRTGRCPSTWSCIRSIRRWSPNSVNPFWTVRRAAVRFRWCLQTKRRV